MKCYQCTNGNDFALVFIDSIIMCMLLKLWAKIKNRDCEFCREAVDLGLAYVPKS